MALVCFVSAKGAPGVTLTAVGVAAAWPLAAGQRKLLLEADPAGGSLAGRYQLGRQPGLVTLAAAARHGLTREDLWAHAQLLPGGLAVVVAPERADRTAPILMSSATRLGGWLRDLPDVITVADGGRLAPNTTSGLCRQGDLVVMVARPCTEQIHAGTALLDELADTGLSVGWLLIGRAPHTAVDVERVTGFAVIRTLSDDARGASALTSGRVAGRFGQPPLVREIATFAADLARSFTPTTRHDTQHAASQAGDVSPVREAV